MKLKHMLVTVLILIVISAGIIAYVKFVYNSSGNTDETGDEDAISTKNDPETIQLIKQIDTLETKFDNALKKWSDNWSSEVTTLTAMKRVIDEIDLLAKTNTKVMNLNEYNELRTKTADEFFSDFEYAFTNKLSFYIFWCDFVSAKKLTTENASEIIPNSMRKNKRMMSLQKSFENRIASAQNRQSEVSEEVTKFIEYTYKLAESDGFDNLNEKEVIAKVKDWISELFEFAFNISTDDSGFLYPRLVSAYTKFENTFFNKCDLSQDPILFDYARQHFPLSNELLAYVEESLTDSRKIQDNNIMKMVRKLRQDFMAFGPINHFFTSQLISQHFNSYLTHVNNLAYLFLIVNDSMKSKVMQKYLQSWFTGISFAVITSSASKKDASLVEIMNALIDKSAFSSILEKVLSAKGFEQIDLNYDRIITAIDIDVNKLEALKPFNTQNISMYEIARMYLNASAFEAKDSLEVLNELLDTKLAEEVKRVNAIESKASQNVEFAEMFTTIDMLISTLEYYQSPALAKVGETIKKYYNDELQHKVINALRYDENTIAELAKKLDGDCTFYFAGFIADLYNQVLLGLKGDKEISQEFINENRNLFFAHYKAYISFTNKMRKDPVNNLFDALVFTRIFNNVSKMSLIDDMLESQELKRKNLLTSLESKYRSNQALIENLQTGNNLIELRSAIADNPVNWDSWHHFVKMKSHMLKLKMNNTKNQYDRLGIGFIDDLLIKQFYKILMDNFEEQQNETWINRAKWFLGNFTLDSIKKNNIDEKLKILIK